MYGEITIFKKLILTRNEIRREKLRTLQTLNVKTVKTRKKGYE